jgi:glycosyltransferase EpsF
MRTTRGVRRPISVLHVFGRLGIGGAETWLANVVGALDPGIVRVDVVVHRSNTGEYDEHVRRSGGTVKTVTLDLSYLRELRKALRGYDVVHSNVGPFSAIVLAIARAAGVPCRVAHSHSSDFVRGKGWAKRLYVRAMRTLFRQVMTGGLACSPEAAEGLFGSRWHGKPTVEVLPYGYPFDRFRSIDKHKITELRHQLLPGDAHRLIGYVGRMSATKNHAFVLDIAKASQQAGRDFERFVVVGTGEMEDLLIRRAGALGLSADKVVFLGQRLDVPEIMVALDALVMPSLVEGLGIVALEAQAANTPTVLSTHFPASVRVAPWLLRVLSPDNPRAWLAAVDDLLATPVALPPPLEALEAVFGLRAHVEKLEEFYERQFDKLHG